MPVAICQEGYDELQRQLNQAEADGDCMAAEIDQLRTALRPFAEIGRRLKWDKIPDDDRLLDEHVMEAPAPELGPDVTYCLFVSAFRRAAHTYRDEAALESNDIKT